MVSQTLWAVLRNWHIMAQWTHKLWQFVSRKLEINEYCWSGNSNCAIYDQGVYLTRPNRELF